jgi:hypothetical protein
LYFSEIENLEISNDKAAKITLNKERNTFLLPNMFTRDNKNMEDGHIILSKPLPFPLPNPNYLNLKGGSTDNISIDLEQKKMYEAINESEIILNYIEWDKQGYHILNSDYGKILYLRLQVEPCQTYEAYHDIIKNNILFLSLEISKWENCITTNIESFALGEDFLLLKNLNFDEVKITIKNSITESEELNELLILKNKNVRDEYYDGNIVKW